MLQLIQSYRPTLGEIERCLRLKLHIDFGQIMGNFNALDNAGNSIMYDDQLGSEYLRRLTRLLDRLEAHWQVRMDFTKVTECTKDGDEPMKTYYARLMEVFTAHSGIPKPDP